MGEREGISRAERGVAKLQWAVDRCKEGVPGANVVLFELVHQALYRHCLGLTGNPEAAEDLFQIALFRALRSLPGLEDGRCFMGWAFRIARNAFYDQIRKSGRDPQKGCAAETAEPFRCEEDKQVEMLSVRSALAKLDEEDRALMLMIHVEGYTFREAGRTLGMSQRAVRRRLMAARRRLVTGIAGGGLDQSARYLA